jgi:hypothetical protein
MKYYFIFLEKRSSLLQCWRRCYKLSRTIGSRLELVRHLVRADVWRHRRPPHQALQLQTR